MDIFGWRITRIQTERVNAVERTLFDLQRLSVHPGDILFLRTTGYLTAVARDHLKALMEEQVKHLDCKVLVLEGGLEVGVVGRDFASGKVQPPAANPPGCYQPTPHDGPINPPPRKP